MRLRKAAKEKKLKKRDLEKVVEKPESHYLASFHLLTFTIGQVAEFPRFGGKGLMGGRRVGHQVDSACRRSGRLSASRLWWKDCLNSSGGDMPKGRKFSDKRGMVIKREFQRNLDAGRKVFGHRKSDNKYSSTGDVVQSGPVMGEVKTKCKQRVGDYDRFLEISNAGGIGKWYRR